MATTELGLKIIQVIRQESNWYAGLPSYIQEKYPGRGDCGVIAVMQALDISYDESINLYKQHGQVFNNLPNMAVSNQVLLDLMTKRGWKSVTPRQIGARSESRSTPLHKLVLPKGKCIVYTDRHVSYIVDGVVYDTWDSRGRYGKQIYYIIAEDTNYTASDFWDGADRIRWQRGGRKVIKTWTADGLLPQYLSTKGSIAAMEEMIACRREIVAKDTTVATRDIEDWLRRAFLLTFSDGPYIDGKYRESLKAVLPDRITLD